VIAGTSQKKKSEDEDENSPPIYPERNRSHDEKKWARTSKLRKRRDSDRSCQPCTVLDFIQVELRNFAEDVILWDDLKKLGQLSYLRLLPTAESTVDGSNSIPSTEGT